METTVIGSFIGGGLASSNYTHLVFNLQVTQCRHASSENDTILWFDEVGYVCKVPS